MKRVAPLLAFVALFVIYHTASARWGKDAKIYALLAMLVLYAGSSLALFLMRCRLRREHPEMTPLLDSDSDAPWYWKLLDAVFGLALVVGPPVLVSLVRREPLSWESEFTGSHVLAMFGGVGVYLLGRALVIRQWQQKYGDTDDDD